MNRQNVGKNQLFHGLKVASVRNLQDPDMLTLNESLQESE